MSTKFNIWTSSDQVSDVAFPWPMDYTFSILCIPYNFMAKKIQDILILIMWQFLKLDSLHSPRLFIIFLANIVYLVIFLSWYFKLVFFDI